MVLKSFSGDISQERQVFVKVNVGGPLISPDGECCIFFNCYCIFLRRTAARNVDSATGL